ncbi:putative leucine-rich repeat-containing protein DDB_G0290503 [Drosophila sulfurigaster albostrigata]|uniref:putative leucine-rich repeat-containing protein DDB_G0290503 n=1 Tax=Drosophila sulfurigaster albostrigata TaxID=89887 RepID=UPI002D219F17|nr:putative leucine-rich repeat-containing protein DDB_G0290503 [Drosophila sulfurigaster albostrigata]
MPKVKLQKEVKQPQPYPPQMRRGDNGNDITRMATKNNGKQERQKSTVAKDDPSSNENVLIYYLKQHKLSIESAKKDSNEMAEQFYKMKMTVAECNQENAKLKNVVAEMEQQAEQLKMNYAKVTEEKQNLKHNYDKFNAMFTSFETDYDERFANMNLDLNRLKSDLLASQKRNEILLTQLKEEEKSHEMIAKLGEELGQKDAQLAVTEMKLAQLQQENKQLQTDFEVKQIELEHYHENKLQEREVELSGLKGELQQLTENYAAKIKDSAQREQKIVELEMKLKESVNLTIEMEQKLSQAGASYIKRQQELEQETMEITDRLRAQIQQKQAEISSLELGVQQLKDNFNRQVAENDRCVAELSLTKQSLKEAETRNFEQQKHNDEVSRETLLKVERFESDAKVKDAKIDELLANIEDVTKEFKSKEKNYEEVIAALKTNINEVKANHHQENEALQHDLKKCENQMDERQEQFNQVELELLARIKKLSDEQKNSAKEFDNFKELHEKTTKEQQDKLKQQEDDLEAQKKNYINMEKAKNAIIAELKYKISHVRQVFGQPVGSATILNREQNKAKTNGTLELMVDNNMAITQQQQKQPVDVVEIDAASDDSISKIAAAIVASAPAAITTEPSTSSSMAPDATAKAAKSLRPRRHIKRKTFLLNDSEFNSDTDDDDVGLWKPKSKKPVAKKKFTDENVPITNVFDYVKNI